MIIENDTAKLISINGKGLPTLNLLPGENNVDDDHWVKLKEAKGKPGDLEKKIAPGFVHVLIESRQIFEKGASPKKEEAPKAEAKKEVVKEEKPVAAKAEVTEIATPKAKAKAKSKKLDS